MLISSISSYISTEYSYQQQPQTEDDAQLSAQRAGQRPDDAAQSSDHTKLSEEEQRQVAELKRRDREVRAHEAAHVAAGGAYVRGGAVFSYQTGPDGKRYAVGGEVSIDTSPVRNNPRATIIKMETVKRAALAPAQPSSQDRSVAAAASQEEFAARLELAQDARNSSPSRGPEHPAQASAMTNTDSSPKTRGYASSAVAVPWEQDARDCASIYVIA